MECRKGEGDTKSFALARLTTSDVKDLLGPEPYFAQGKNPGVAAEEIGPALESARVHGPPIIFLGLQEPGGVHGLGEGNILPSSDFSKKSDAIAVVKRLHGEPIFALDVTRLPSNGVNALVASASVVGGGVALAFIDGRAAMGHLNQIDSGIFAVGRSMVDWNARIKVRFRSYSPMSTKDHSDISSTALCILWLVSIFAVGRMETLLLVTLTLDRERWEGAM